MDFLASVSVLECVIVTRIVELFNNRAVSRSPNQSATSIVREKGALPLLAIWKGTGRQYAAFSICSVLKVGVSVPILDRQTLHPFDLLPLFAKYSSPVL